MAGKQVKNLAEKKAIEDDGQKKSGRKQEFFVRITTTTFLRIDDCAFVLTAVIIFCSRARWVGRAARGGAPGGDDTTIGRGLRTTGVLEPDTKTIRYLKLG